MKLGKGKKKNTELTMDQDMMNTTDSKKKKKKLSKKAIRNIIIIVIVVLVAAYFVVSSVMAGSAALPVSVMNPTYGNVDETLSTSGTVESAEIKTYFSPVNAQVSELKVELGDSVKKGDTLVSYDAADLERSKETAVLQAKVSESNYKSLLQESAEAATKNVEANTNLPVLEQQIKDEKSNLKDLNKQMEDLKYTYSKSYSEESAALQAEISKRNHSDEETANLNQQLANSQANANYLSHEPKIRNLQNTIDEVTDRIAEYEKYQTKMESQQSSSEAAVKNQYDKESLDATAQVSALSQQAAEETYTEAANGIKADFDGIVTSLAAVQGMTATEGLELMKIQSTDNVEIKVPITKYDLDKIAEGQNADITIAGHKYEGMVTKVNRMAEKDANNTPVVTATVMITNPDEYIYLGIEAKVIINTNSKTNVLVLPVEAVNADKDGDFIYVVENGVVARRSVTTGISSDNMIEIIDGVTESDQVISVVTDGIMEGVAVTPMPVATEETGITVETTATAE